MLQRLISLARGLPKDGSDAGHPIVKELLRHLKEIPAEQLGRPSVAVTRSPKVTFCSIFENDDVTVGLFVLDKGASIPLHNHPNMMVLSRLVSGSLHLCSYDFEESPMAPARLQIDSVHRARLVHDETIVAPETFSLFSSEGNVHSLHAPTERAVVLEVLRPSYTDGLTSERPCAYLRCEPDSTFATAAPPSGAGALLRRFWSSGATAGSMLGGRAFGATVALRVVPEPDTLEILRASLAPPP
jgi:hypothetical protein